MAETGILVRSPAMGSGSVWAELSFRPSAFVKKTRYPDDSDEDPSTVGKLPPDSESDSDE